MHVTSCWLHPAPLDWDSSLHHKISAFATGIWFALCRPARKRARAPEPGYYADITSSMNDDSEGGDEEEDAAGGFGGGKVRSRGYSTSQGSHVVISSVNDFSRCVRAVWLDKYLGWPMHMTGLHTWGFDVVREVFYALYFSMLQS